MGCCFGTSSSEPSERTPLAHAPAAPATSTPAGEPRSARIPGTAPRPPADPEEIRRIKIRETRIEELDKSFQDLSRLYNDMVEQLEKLNVLSVDMTSHFCNSAPARGQSASKDMILTMLQAVKQDAGESLSVSRKHKYCVELHVDESRVQSEASRSVRLFNTLNSGIRSCMDKLPSLQASLIALQESEKRFQRDIMVASLGTEGPNSASNCRHNFQEVERAIAMADRIKSKCDVLFKNCSEAARALF